MNGLCFVLYELSTVRYHYLVWARNEAELSGHRQKLSNADKNHSYFVFFLKFTVKKRNKLTKLSRMTNINFNSL